MPKLVRLIGNVLRCYRHCVFVRQKQAGEKGKGEKGGAVGVATTAADSKTEIQQADIVQTQV